VLQRAARLLFFLTVDIKQEALRVKNKTLSLLHFIFSPVAKVILKNL